MSAKKALLQSAMDLRCFLTAGVCSRQKAVLNRALKPEKTLPKLHDPHGVLEVRQTFSDEKKSSFIDAFENLKSRCLSCTRCRLSQTRRKVVFGSGNADAPLWAVGEAPGGDEDIQGLPFVGAAGQLLTKMLAAIGVDRNLIFITNILKCRPPGNRNPEEDEIQCCSPYLEEQMRLKNPKVILALGGFSSAYFLQSKEGITRLRGKSYEKNGRIIVPTFHPSALLRNEKWKYPAWEDLKMLKEILESKKINPGETR